MLTMTQEFILRVKSNSELDRILTALDDSYPDRLTGEQLTQAGGKKRAGAFLRMCANFFFDNLRVSWDSYNDTYQMDYTDVVGDDRQYFLRVITTSRLGVALDVLTNAKHPVEGSELQEAAGTKEVGIELRLVSQSIDNIRLNWTGSDTDTYQLSYTDVVGSRVKAQKVIIQADQAGAGGSDKPQKDEDFEDIRWPQAPPILDSGHFNGWFIRPSWIKEAEAMLNLGRHVSLASPPSIGKDTGVQYLAAQAGKPLVHVGGDAGLRKRDLIGTPEARNGSTYFQVSEFAAAVVNGWWADITEINAAEPDTILLLNAILEEPKVINIRGKQYPVHPDFRLFISYNPGLIGTKPLPQSFKDRFYSIKLRWFTPYELRQRLEAHGMPKAEGAEDILVNGQPMRANDWTDKVVDYGIKLWEEHERGQLQYQITFRRLNDTVALMTNGVYDDVKKALKAAVVGAIDSTPNARVAEKVLDEICNGY
jgi:hypothetical protein